MPIELTVVVRGETFLLSEDQINLEAPNLFSKFINEHSETPRPPLQSSRNPRLFSLILDYLCGYAILPIHDADLPPRMTQETLLKNLKADAVYYGLSELVKLIERHQPPTAPIHTKPQNVTDKPKDASSTPRISPFFHFPGRVTNFNSYWNAMHSFVEFPFPLDLMKSFTISLENNGRYTILSLDVPSAPHELLQISISDNQDFRFELGVESALDNSSTISNLTDNGRLASEPSGTAAPLHVWTHLAFVQRVDEGGVVAKRTLCLNGKELVTSNENVHIYNPAPSQTRIALMRGSWDRERISGFYGQIEDLTLFGRALDQEELSIRAAKENMPSEHGWPKDREAWDFDPVY